MLLDTLRNQRTTTLTLRVFYTRRLRRYRRSRGSFITYAVLQPRRQILGIERAIFFTITFPLPQTFVLFFANSRLPFDITSPRFSSVPRSITRRFAFFSAPSRQIVWRKGMISSRRKEKKRAPVGGRKETHVHREGNSERFANGSRYECFPMACYLRARHEYLLQKKVLTRTLLRARRRSSRSYAKSIRE